MSHKLLRLANKYLYNQPTLTTQESLEELTNYVESRGIDLSIGKDLKAAADAGSLGEGNIAVIPVEGPLTYEETGWEALCGMSSYQGILDMTRQAINEGFTTIVYDHNSGGGEAYGAFETAQDIQRLTQDANVHTIAYVDGISGSAAYALAVAADEIIINPQAEVGSVGVVTKLINTSQKDKKDGVQTTYVYAGDSKIPYTPDGEFTKSFIEDLQQKVNSLYEDFLNHVSTMRGIGKEAVRSTQAKMFSADKALEINFVDKVMTRNKFAEYLADINDNGNKMSLKSLTLQVKEEKEKMQLEELQSSLDAAVADKNEALEKLTATQEQLSAKEKELQELQASLTEVNSKLESVEKENQEKMLSQRKEKLTEVLAEDQVDSVFEAVKGLDEIAFNTILSGYKASSEQLEKSEMFQEKGVDAQAAKSEEEVSSVMNLIKQSKAK